MQETSFMQAIGKQVNWKTATKSKLFIATTHQTFHAIFYSPAIFTCLHFLSASVLKFYITSLYILIE